MTSNDPRDRVVIVLERTKNLVNIAGVVRVMLNTGLSRLRLVAPDEFDAGRVTGIAHRSEALVEAIEIHGTLHDAVADAVHVIGTSARPRVAPAEVSRPRSAAPAILEQATRGRVAIVFGREDRGLTNDALDLCREIIVIPTAPEHPSLNLAQASLVICYELLLASGRFAPEDELGAGKKARASPPATQEDVERMYAALEEGLGRIDFFKGTREPAAVLRTLRALLDRTEPTEREARLLQAIGYEIGNYLDRLGCEPDD